jgi:tRNA-Thr(GGU) m(6)t(6)A37 methyltransferase TsaA
MQICAQNPFNAREAQLLPRTSRFYIVNDKKLQDIPMNIEPIGIVKSSVVKPIDANWGSVISKIHLKPELAEGLKGLEEFSHAVIIYFIEDNEFDPKDGMVRRPRGLPQMSLIGVFAQRARHRPNPIAITTVQIVTVNENILTVKGLDAIDKTPVLDIKPYVPAYDNVVNPKAPAWVDTIMQGYF